MATSSAPYCGQAEPAVSELLRDYGDVSYVWRHLPLNDVHPHAQLAAEAAEAAADQGNSGRCTTPLGHQSALRLATWSVRGELGLDVERFTEDLKKHAGAAGSQRTSTAPTSAMFRARRPSSSTGGAITAPTTSTHFPRRSGPPRRARLSGGSRARPVAAPSMGKAADESRLARRASHEGRSPHDLFSPTRGCHGHVTSMAPGARER